MTSEQKAIAKENKTLPAETVVESLREVCPSVLPFTKLVGRWLWIIFPEKPPYDVLEVVKLMGFSFSRRRQAWMNPCGHFTRRARGYDPRDKYGVRDVVEDEPEETEGEK